MYPIQHRAPRRMHPHWPMPCALSFQPPWPSGSTCCCNRLPSQKETAEMDVLCSDKTGTDPQQAEHGQQSSRGVCSDEEHMKNLNRINAEDKQMGPTCPPQESDIFFPLVLPLHLSPLFLDSIQN